MNLHETDLNNNCALGEVRKKNISFKLCDLLPIIQETIRSDYINQLWASCCRHAIELEDTVMKLENIVEDFVSRPLNPIVIRLEDSEESDSSDSEDSVDSDESTIR